MKRESSYSLCDNDRALVEAATRVMEDMHHAAGAVEAITIRREAHLIGGCRMAVDETDGVVDTNLRSFAVPDLLIADDSVCPTQGSANPALTIMALAARAADYLTSATFGAVKSEAAFGLAQGLGDGTPGGEPLHPLPRTGVEMPQQIVDRLGAARRPQHRGGIIGCGNLTDDDRYSRCGGFCRFAGLTRRECLVLFRSHCLRSPICLSGLGCRIYPGHLGPKPSNKPGP